MALVTTIHRDCNSILVPLTDKVLVAVEAHHMVGLPAIRYLDGDEGNSALPVGSLDKHRVAEGDRTEIPICELRFSMLTVAFSM